MFACLTHRYAGIETKYVRMYQFCLRIYIFHLSANMHNFSHGFFLKSIPDHIIIFDRILLKKLRSQNFSCSTWIGNCNYICAGINLCSCKLYDLISHKLHVTVRFFFFLTKLFIKNNRLHNGTCCADRSRNISDNRHIQVSGFQNTDCIQHNLCSSFLHTHRCNSLPLCDRIDRISRYMRLINLTTHSHLSPHSFCLNRHAEWNTYILKTAIFIIGLCKIRHHLCIQMCFRPCNPRFVHQICRDHIHHSARTDTWRPVCLFMM